MSFAAAATICMRRCSSGTAYLPPARSSSLPRRAPADHDRPPAIILRQRSSRSFVDGKVALTLPGSKPGEPRSADPRWPGGDSLRSGSIDRLHVIRRTFFNCLIYIYTHNRCSGAAAAATLCSRGCGRRWCSDPPRQNCFLSFSTNICSEACFGQINDGAAI